MVKLDGLLPKVGPGSTVAGAIILDAIITQAAKNVLDKGKIPPVYFSGNLPDAAEYNEKFSKQAEIFTRKMRHK